MDRTTAEMTVSRYLLACWRPARERGVGGSDYVDRSRDDPKSEPGAAMGSVLNESHDRARYGSNIYSRFMMTSGRLDC